MKTFLFLAFALTLLLPARAADSAPITETQFTEAVAAALKKIETIKPGQTRKDLLKVLSRTGGLSTPGNEPFVYPLCPYIRVMVHFQGAGDPRNLKDGPDDIIVSISKPYLKQPVAD